MPHREHTDPTALDHFYNLPSGATIEAVTAPWYRRAWTWLKENIFAEPFQPVEPISQDEPIRRRIRIYKRGTKLARRLHRLPQGEAREILEVTAMLLGFEATKVTTRRQGVHHG